MNAVVGGLAEVVAHRAEHDGDLLRIPEIVDAPARLVDDQQRVDPDVSFGVPLRLLRTADERVELGEQALDDAHLERQREAERRPARAQQQLFDLPPDPLGRQIVERDGAAERRGRRIDRQREPRRELDGAEHAQAVVAEGGRIDRAEQPPIEIAAPVERILVGRR